MKKLATLMAGLAAGLLLTLGLATNASAATSPIAVQSDCNKGWYVNEDEGPLLPEQVEGGFLFDGPSLVHHVTNFKLASTPTDGSFVATVQAGVAPLFKMETTNPYSTVNKTAAGKYWSSKVTSGPGSQGEPVDSPADLVGKWNYTEATTTFSFGVGYANDGGNKALVKSIKFNGTTYDLTCKPKPSPTPAKTTPAAATQDCQAYLYEGTKQNLCDRFPGEQGKVNCADVGYQVRLVNSKVDPWGLDGNKGVIGLGCESFPRKPTATKTTSAPAVAGGPELPRTGNPLTTALFVGLGLLGVGFALWLVAALWRARGARRFTA